VAAARLTCSKLASIGLDHFETKLVLIYHRDSFRRLGNFATHPVLSKHIRSLYYHADRYYKAADQSDWNDARVDFAPELRAQCGLPPYDGASPDGWLEDGGSIAAEDTAFEQRKAEVPFDLRQEAYVSYKQLHNDQSTIERTGYDGALFRGCSHIQDVILDFYFHVYHYHHNDAEARRRKYASTIVRFPYGDRDWRSQGVSQVSSLVKAVQQSGTQLDSLTL
jgi:hypothetical protein